MADGRVRIESMKEGSDNDIPGVNIERLLRPISVIVGRVSVDGRIVIEGSESVGRSVIKGRVSVDGGTVSKGSETDDGSMVTDDSKSVSVAGGNKVCVMLYITEKLVIDEMPDMLGIEVTGIVFTIGLPSGPSCTARLANLTTVLVPLRAVPVSGLPKFCVNVHKPSA